eukprot:gene24140-28967_t
MVDYLGFQHYLRWGLILLFMILKAGLIVAIFMHMAWERLALVYANTVCVGASRFTMPRENLPADRTFLRLCKDGLRFHHLAVEVPGCMAEHRYNDRQTNKERQKADHQQ